MSCFDSLTLLKHEFLVTFDLFYIIQNTLEESIMSRLGSVISNTVTFLMQSVQCVRVNYEDPLDNDEDMVRTTKTDTNLENKGPESLRTVKYGSVSGNDDAKDFKSTDRISQSEGDTKRRKSIRLHILIHDDTSD